jgi:uncharacterized protein
MLQRPVTEAFEASRLRTTPIEAIERREAQRGNAHSLDPAPIPAGWILQGTPEARGRILCCSSDEMSLTVMWDCTAGSFNWFYDIDETVCVMEGYVIVCDSAGDSRTLFEGDIFFFPAGTRFQWTVPRYVRKLAFIHVPMSRKMRLARHIYRRVRRLLRPDRATSTGTAQLLKGQ